MAETKPDRAAVEAASDAADYLHACGLLGDWKDFATLKAKAAIAAIISRHYAPLVEAAERVLNDQSLPLNDLRAALDAVRGKK